MHRYSKLYTLQSPFLVPLCWFSPGWSLGPSNVRKSKSKWCQSLVSPHSLIQSSQRLLSEHLVLLEEPWSPASAWGRDSKGRMLRAASSWVLNNSCGKPIPVFSHPYRKIDFLVFKWDFLCFSLGHLSLFLSLGTAEKRLLQPEQSQLHHPLPEGRCSNQDNYNSSFLNSSLLHYRSWSDLTIHTDEEICACLPLNIWIGTTLAPLSAKWLFLMEARGNIIKQRKGNIALQLHGGGIGVFYLYLVITNLRALLKSKVMSFIAFKCILWSKPQIISSTSTLAINILLSQNIALMTPKLMLWLQRGLKQHLTNTVKWNLQSPPWKLRLHHEKIRLQLRLPACSTPLLSWTHRVNVKLFFWLCLNTLHGNKPKGQWGESPSFLCIAPTVKHLSCSCKSAN